MEKLKMLVDKHLKEKNHILQLKKEKLSGVNPKEVLKRGYTITVKNGKVIKDKNEVQSGEVLETHFYNGKIESIVKKVKNLYMKMKNYKKSLGSFL